MFNYYMRPPTLTVKIVASILLLSLLAVALGLMDAGVYGLTLFALLPVAVGALASWACFPETGKRALRTGALAVFGALCLLLLLGREGMICLAMATPLAVPLGALGGWLVYRCRKSQASPAGLALLVLLPPTSVTWDLHKPPEIYEVRSSVTIAASPEKVWKHVVAFPALPEPDDWVFRTGIAYPIRARIEGHGPGAVRYCEFSTGPFVEPIEVWNEPGLLRFSVTENPSPMVERSPYGEIAARHLHDYMVASRGQFQLTRLPGNQTRLEGTTWYRHGLLPAGYWRLWSDAIIHRIHLRVLTHIRNLAETAQ